MSNILEEAVENLLLSNNVNIHKPLFKTSENFLALQAIYGCSLEIFIEHYLLSKQEVINTYESIYDMGNPYELTDEESTDIAVAYEVILMGLSPKKVKPENICAYKYEILDNFLRPGGLIDRLNSHLKFDLESFDKKDMQYKRERCKILYLFYKLDHTPSFPKNILKLLGNPSAENIDASSVNINTYNGFITKTIKDSLKKELSLSKTQNIQHQVDQIISTWNRLLQNAQMYMDFFFAENIEYDYEETIRILSVDSKKYVSQNLCQSSLSPLEMLYLKMVQLDYEGIIKDIRHINEIEKDYVHNISPELIEEMKKLYHSPINTDNIEQYIDENALRLSKYVYLKEKTQKEDVRKIRNAKGKILKLVSFCRLTNSIPSNRAMSNELQLVSFLQAVILDDPKETFDYTFYGYQNHFKHMKRVQAALKNEAYVPTALQFYWIRKIVDRWYANLGRNSERIYLRKLELSYDNIILKILNQPCLNEMMKIHNFYLDKIDNALITTSDQLDAVIRFREALHNIGYEYIDHTSIIRYAFLYPQEIDYTLRYLINKIYYTIRNQHSLMKERLTVHSANGKEIVDLDLDIVFDHQNKQCFLQEFEIVSSCCSSN